MKAAPSSDRQSRFGSFSTRFFVVSRQHALIGALHPLGPGVFRTDTQVRTLHAHTEELRAERGSIVHGKSVWDCCSTPTLL